MTPPAETPETVADVLAEYRAWREARAAQSLHEAEGTADADDWASLDDQGCDLARRFAEALDPGERAR